ncbi:MAG TPA: hypothetical protein VFK57_16805 [Vicinamibacterales bacterium]|nr:hypothetical protein [Vicinamibacterales bacterium]
MLPIAPLLLAGLLFSRPSLPFEPLTEAHVLDAPTRHIRASDTGVRSLLRRGFRNSPTFAALIMRLQRSDVIVYVEGVPRLPGALEGRMMMLPRVNGYRYVRIQIAPRGAPEDSIAVLGHELQHAVEIADAMEVIDSDGLERLYARIGVRSGPQVYDTNAAQQTGRVIRRELGVIS